MAALDKPFPAIPLATSADAKGAVLASYREALRELETGAQYLRLRIRELEAAR